MDHGGARVSGRVIGTREEILAHIATLLGAIPGINGVYRDRGDFTGAQLPIAVLLDGGEELIQEIMPRKLGKMPPAMFTLKPEIAVIAKPRDTPSNETLAGQPVPIGPELSDWRDKVLASIINDETLLTLLTANGQIVYRGCDTDMQWGGSLSGALQVYLEFTYVWVPPTP